MEWTSVSGTISKTEAVKLGVRLSVTSKCLVNRASDRPLREVDEQSSYWGSHFTIIAETERPILYVV